MKFLSGLAKPKKKKNTNGSVVKRGGVVQKKAPGKTTWERMFSFAYDHHNTKTKAITAFVMRMAIKPILFNVDFRISFFSGIKANSDSGGLVDFLNAQKNITRELKSPHLPFFEDIGRKVATGRLYRALGPYFPAAEVSIFSAGETSNNMKKACDVAVTYIDRAYGLNSKVKAFGATIAFYLVAFVAFIIIFTNTIAGQVSGLAEQMRTQLPPITQFYVDLNEFLQTYIIWIVLAVVVVIFAIAYRLPKGSGKLRMFLHQYVPGYRFYRRYTSSAFLLSLSAMLGAGMPFSEAIKTIKIANNPEKDGKSSADSYVSHFMAKIQRKTSGGAKPQKALDVDFMPKAMYLNVSQFIKGRDIGDTLMSVAKYELDSLSRKIDKYQSYLRFAILALGGLIIVQGYRAAIEPALAMMTNSGY